MTEIVEDNQEQEEVLLQILRELRMINAYLNEMTDLDINRGDLDE